MVEVWNADGWTFLNYESYLKYIKEKNLKNTYE